MEEKLGDTIIGQIVASVLACIITWLLVIVVTFIYTMTNNASFQFITVNKIVKSEDYPYVDYVYVVNDSIEVIAISSSIASKLEGCEIKVLAEMAPAINLQHLTGRYIYYSRKNCSN